MQNNHVTAVLHMVLLAWTGDEYLSGEKLSLSVLQLAGHVI